MNDAERLKEIAERPAIERMYEQNIEKLTELAKAGIRKTPIEILKKSFFVEQARSNGETGDDDHAERVYEMQHELVQKFRENGFTVTEDRPTNIITLDSIGNDPLEQRKQEFERLFLETRFWIEW